MSEINPIEGELLGKEEKKEYLTENIPDVPDSVDPTDVIKTTQAIRMSMIRSELRKGMPNASDKDFLQLLRDSDNAALTTRKIDVDERTASDSERIAQAQGELLRLMNGKNPFAVDIVGVERVTMMQGSREAATLPEAILVPGITDIGTHNIDPDEFQKSIDDSEAQMDNDD